MARKNKGGTKIKKDTRKSIVDSDEEDRGKGSQNKFDMEHDEVDEFYNKKDKILLAGTKREQHDGKPDHVFAMSSDESELSEDDMDREILNEDHAKDMMSRLVKKKQLDSDIEDEEEEPSDAKAWGRKRQDFYSTDFVDKDFLGTMTEKEREVAKMEEEEALNIQKRLAEEIDEDAFGLENLKAPQLPEDDVSEKKKKSKSKIDVDLSKLPKKKLMKMVEEESPELQGLISDCRMKLRELDEELVPLVDLLRNNKLPQNTSAGKYVYLRHNLLVVYTTNICFYLSLKAKRVNIKTHPIIKRLSQLKKLIGELDTVRNKLLPEISAILARVEAGNTEFTPKGQKQVREDIQAASEDEEEASSDEDEGVATEDDAEFDEEEDEENVEVAKEAKRNSKRVLTAAEEEIMALYDDLSVAKKPKMDEEDAEDEGAEENDFMDESKIFGDTDSENDEPVFNDGKDSEEEEEEEDEDEKETKLNEVTEEANEEEAEEQEGDDRRAINYQISKNKGLTPHRKKEYRNPRVRHRMKFQKATVRRKGQIPAMRNESGHYGGEQTGIKSNVIKSVKLK